MARVKLTVELDGQTAYTVDLTQAHEEERYAPPDERQRRDVYAQVAVAERMLAAASGDATRWLRAREIEA